MKSVFYGLALVTMTTFGGANFVAAQDTGDSLSADELKERFDAQKTRGLVLAPTGAEDNTGEDTAATPAADSTYVQVAPEQQVSIQISFDFDSSALRNDQKPKLATLCEVMKEVDIDVFRIVGHTDASGSASYNERLSTLRAQEVKRFLISDCGIAEDRLEAVGVGEAYPLNADDPRADINRRVEFQALS